MRNVWVRELRKTQLSQNWIPKICGAVKRTITLEDEAGKKLKKKDKWKKNIWILKIFWAVKRAMTSEPHNNVSQKRITQWFFCYIFRYVKEFQGK